MLNTRGQDIYFLPKKMKEKKYEVFKAAPGSTRRNEKREKI